MMLLKHDSSGNIVAPELPKQSQIGVDGTVGMYIGPTLTKLPLDNDKFFPHPLKRTILHITPMGHQEGSQKRDSLSDFEDASLPLMQFQASLLPEKPINFRYQA